MRLVHHDIGPAATDDELVIAATVRVLHLPQYSVEIERRRLLTRRKLLKCLDLVGDNRLHPIQKIGVGDHPIPIGIRILIRAFERIAAQIEHLRRSSFTNGSNQHISCLARCSMSTIFQSPTRIARMSPSSLM